MRKVMTRLKSKLSLLYFFAAFCVVIVSGCASVPGPDNDAIAWVDGEPLTRDDLGYSLQIAHRREDLSNAGEFNISQYIDKLIDDRLIVQEARRMKLEDSPEVKEKVQEYILRESVVRLYNDEIVSKVKVTAEEVADYYSENYESYTLKVIEAENEDEAGKIMLQLQGGREFDDFALDHDRHSENQRAKELVVQRKNLRPALQEGISGLKPGDTSSIIKDHDKYYIVKLLDRQPAPEEELPSVSNSIESVLKEQKIKKLSDEYLAELRKESGVKIDRELLASVNLEESDKKREEWLNDKRTLVDAKNMTLTIGDFVAMLPEKTARPHEEVLDKWLDRKLVDIEALSRNYDTATDLNTMLQRYKNELLKSAFGRNVIMPQIKISDEEAEEYYQAHQNDYARPVRYRIQQITLKSPEDAQEVLNSLAGGANFAWLARTKSKDAFAPAGGVTDGRTKNQLPEPVREMIDGLKQGDVSPVFQLEGEYLIVRLMEKSGFEVEEFSNVKGTVLNAVYKEKYFKIYNAYVDKLRNEARIELNDETIRSYERNFKNQ